MPNKQNRREYKLKIRKQSLLAAAVVALSIFAVFQLSYDWQVHQGHDLMQGEPLITSLIISAVNNLEAPVPVDAQTGAVYFPDVRLMVPAPGQDYALRQIKYANMSQGTDFGLQVTSQGVLSSAEVALLTAQANASGQHKSANDQMLAVFAKVPNLQACARGVQLFYAPQRHDDGGLILRFSKQLANGKTLYAYTENTCKEPQLNTVLVNYLRQIQSY